MKLTDLYVPTGERLSFEGVKQSAKVRGNTGNSFESVLKAEKTPYEGRKNEVKPKRNEKAADSEKRAEETKQPEKAEKPEVSKTDTAKEKPEPKKDDTAKTEEELAAELAEALGMPVEAVMQAMAALGLSAADLAVPANVTAFAQALLGASSPVELLGMPGAADVVRKVGKTVESWDLAEPEVSTVFAVAETENMFVGADMQNAVGDYIAARKNMAGETGQDSENPDVEVPVETDEAAFVKAVVSETHTAGSYTAIGEGFGNIAEQGAPQEKSPDAGAYAHGVGGNVVTESELSAVRETAAAGRAGVDTLEVVKQIVERMKVDVKADTTELRLVLKPESLGEVSMKISTQNGIVTAQFYAENQRVKEIIEAQFNQLKNVLDEKGVQVAEMSAYVGQENTGQEHRSGSGRNVAGRQVSGIRAARVMERNDNESEAVSGNEGRNVLEVDVRA